MVAADLFMKSSCRAWHSASAPGAAVLILPIGLPNSSSSGLKFVILRLDRRIIQAPYNLE
jgi:hypothetical protein